MPRGTIVLCVAMSSFGSMQFRGSCVGERDLLAHDSAHGLDFSFAGPLRVFSLAVSKNLLESRAGRLWQCDPGSLSSRRLCYADPQSPERVCKMLEKRLSQGRRLPQSLVVPQAAESFENAMLDALLSELSEPRRPEPSLARRRIAHRAAAILHQRCREELTISDLCAAVRASRRTLHLGFLELYGVGPMTYLKYIRLNAVRRELRQHRRSDRSVTTVATSWGFNHLGRFSQAYMSLFGVLPSEDGRMKHDSPRQTLSS